MSGFKHYKRKGLSEMRPYVLGESLDGISISDADKKLPTLEGGYIARNPQNHDDKWYVSKEYHEANLEEALEVAENAVEEAKIFGLTFGQAVNALKNGKLVARSGWNGKGMFIVKQIPAEIGLDIIPKMQSLPQSAKDKLIAMNQAINYTNQMLIVNSEGRADSWVPSSSDVFAEDWQIVE